MSRRPSVSIYDYPEELNPFKDESTTPTTPIQINGQKSCVKEPKEPKNKFWTFGRSKKKQRSNSFSIKSKWSGLFGKRKDDDVEIRKPNIATVSSTYKRGTVNGFPVAPPRLSKDQQEFDEALGTLARRRKYTLDNSSSRYSSSLTMNGDPGRIYEGSPQDTTASIMGDLTPKPPARRFGQMSPKLTDKLPPLEYRGKDSTNESQYDERLPDETPIPPKRGGPRASQRSIIPVSLNEDDASRSGDVSLRDENENVPEDYVFKRFTHDPIRQSNLSINSCVSISSTVSAYGRKKRRAPQPPRFKEPLESPKETEVRILEATAPKAELQIVETIDIARVTENIDEMTKKSREIGETSSPESPTPTPTESKSKKEDIEETHENATSPSTTDEETTPASRKSSKEEIEEKIPIASQLGPDVTLRSPSNVPEVEVELRRNPESIGSVEIIKEVGIHSSNEEFPLSRHESSGNLSRSDSFSVKEAIEKINRQIKLLEGKKAPSRRSSADEIREAYDRTGSRMSLQETRKNFFRNMVDESNVKVELKELPRAQNDAKIVRLEDPPVAVEGPKEPVKIIELHISEPIKQKPGIIGDRDVNPIPKPRRHSNLGLECKEVHRTQERCEDDDDEKLGNSL